MSIVLAWTLAVQAAAASGPAHAGVTPISFNLATHRPAAEGGGGLPASCRSQDASEIVVCARRRSGANGYPIDYWAKIFATKPLVAETGIAPDASVRAYTEQVDFGDGQVSKRAMVGAKLRF